MTSKGRNLYHLRASQRYGGVRLTSCTRKAARALWVARTGDQRALEVVRARVEGRVARGAGSGAHIAVWSFFVEAQAALNRATFAVAAGVLDVAGVLRAKRGRRCLSFHWRIVP